MVLALISAISSSLGMPILLDLLSQESFVVFLGMREKFFARLERSHRIEPDYAKALSQLAPVCEHHAGAVEGHNQRSYNTITKAAVEVHIAETYFALLSDRSADAADRNLTLGCVRPRAEGCDGFSWQP